MTFCYQFCVYVSLAINIYKVHDEVMHKQRVRLVADLYFGDGQSTVAPYCSVLKRLTESLG